jgi:hypothetical protein
LKTFLTPIESTVPFTPDPPVICFWKWIEWKDHDVPKNRNLESVYAKIELFFSPTPHIATLCTCRVHLSLPLAAYPMEKTPRTAKKYPSLLHLASNCAGVPLRPPRLGRRRAPPTFPPSPTRPSSLPSLAGARCRRGPPAPALRGCVIPSAPVVRRHGAPPAATEVHAGTSCCGLIDMVGEGEGEAHRGGSSRRMGAPPSAAALYGRAPLCVLSMGGNGEAEGSGQCWVATTASLVPPEPFLPNSRLANRRLPTSSHHPAGGVSPPLSAIFHASRPTVSSMPRPAIYAPHVTPCCNVSASL